MFYFNIIILAHIQQMLAPTNVPQNDAAIQKLRRQKEMMESMLQQKVFRVIVGISYHLSKLFFKFLYK